MIKLFFELANTRKDEIQKLKNIRELLREHLMCIYYWRNAEYKNHWEGEIVGFMPIMNKLKNSHKLLSYDIIYENLFTDWADRFSYDVYAYVDKLMTKESTLPEITNIDINNIYKFLEDFYQTVCKKLATEGSIRKQFLYTLIEKLLIKYPYNI